VTDQEVSEAIPALRIHEKFWLALDQFQKMLADMDDPRSKLGVRAGSLENQFRIPPDKDQSPPDAPMVRCSDVALAETFGRIMDKMNPLHARAVRYHFMISSYSQYTETWEKVATNEARYFKVSTKEYVSLLQQGIDHITGAL